LGTFLSVSGCDVAASKYVEPPLPPVPILNYFSRNGFVVLGGKGSDGSALSDAWVCPNINNGWDPSDFHPQEYDFNNQFWSEIVIN
jgi:hypothetical protein